MTPLQQLTDLVNSLLAHFQTHAHTGTDSQKIDYNNLLNKPASVAPTLSSYGGSVVSNTAGTPFPAGWSIAHASGGRYTITHTLGTVNFSVTAIVHGLNITIPTLTSKSSSAFAITTYNQTSATSWSGTDTDFDFIVST